MAFDSTTDSIAHFIGAFSLAQEEARMRSDYDRFLAERAAQKEAEQLALNTARVKSPYKLEDVDTNLKHASGGASTQVALPPTPFEAMQLELEMAPFDFVVPALLAQVDPLPSDQASGSAKPVLSPPSSIIAVTFQSAILFDDDIFGDISQSGFSSLDGLMAVLGKLADAAEALSPVRLNLAEASDDWFAALQALSARLPEAHVISEVNYHSAVIRGADAEGGIFVNGELTEALPNWSDYLPVYFQDKDTRLPQRASDEEEEDAAPDSAAPTEHDYSRDFEDDDASPYDIDPGHHVVSGANTAVNHVSLSSNWLDAPVIAVAGDVMKFDAISQVNVLVGGSTIFGGYGLATQGPAPSTVQNVAQIITQSHQPTVTGQGEAALPPPLPTGGAKDWVMVTIEGDVTQINWVDQFTFATDNDMAEISFSGSNTYLGLGANDIFNHVSMWEIGFTYDLIIVGGKMIDLSIINQVNVLLDGQAIGPSTKTAGTAGSTPESKAVAGAATSAEATTGVPGTGKAGTAKKAVSETKDASAANVTPGTSETAASDVTETGSGTTPPAATTAATAPTTGDNLLWNEARITTTGVDKQAPLDAAMTKQIADLAAGGKGISPEVLANPLFDGIEMLKVLYITGDFITVDNINQTNVIGNVDQINMAISQFADGLNEQITLTTGSNILANFAEIIDDGLDSTIMAGGQTYSDALIHQAGLIETEAPPTGVSLGALANEAVAFLVDDMIAPASAADIASFTDTMITETAGQSDVMQTLLA